MKIFYGVQGTGNGHITRARAMARELSKAGFEVQFQFTGRPANQFFDMDVFNDYQYRQGLTFSTNNGQVSYFKTVLESHPVNFIKDIKSLDLSDYQVILGDFEPVTAWAARLQKKKVVGIGHQYAFNHAVPRTGSDPLAEMVMKYFAPANLGIGLHWHHFDQPILPPIVEPTKLKASVNANKILVYLPFENQAKIVQLLKPYKDYNFLLYSPSPVDSEYDHITCFPLSRDGFQRDLHDCCGIISNAGFELVSEALQLGKKILVKPLHAQMEQLSNAEALKQLNYGSTMHDIDAETIEQWLNQRTAVRIHYPNIAEQIVQIIAEDMKRLSREFCQQVWKQVEVDSAFQLY